MLSIDQESGSRFDTPPIGLLRFQEPNQRPGGVDDLALLVFGVFTTLTTFVAFTPAAVVASALAAELERLVCSVKVPAESFTAALLHDVGEIVLCRHMQPEIMELLAEAQAEGGVDALHAEAEILEVHHGELGGLIAQHWELPEIIVTAITFLHNPEEVVDTHVQLVCDAVCVADAAAQTCGYGLGDSVPAASAHLGSRERLGMTEAGFEELCELLTERVDEVLAWYE